MPDGGELYFHRDNAMSPGFDRLEVGMDVQFLQQTGDEGPQAKRVSAGKHQFGG
ncbi:MAG: cold shock domain-containing protein [Betaproteobacteria bacterium]|nr:cold shock domain-containing protein [Betaproteobacteria bacterium]